MLNACRLFVEWLNFFEPLIFRLLRFIMAFKAGFIERKKQSNAFKDVDKIQLIFDWFYQEYKGFDFVDHSVNLINLTF